MQAFLCKVQKLIVKLLASLNRDSRLRIQCCATLVDRQRSEESMRAKRGCNGASPGKHSPPFIGRRWLRKASVSERRGGWRVCWHSLHLCRHARALSAVEQVWATSTWHDIDVCRTAKQSRFLTLINVTYYCHIKTARDMLTCTYKMNFSHQKMTQIIRLRKYRISYFENCMQYSTSSSSSSSSSWNTEWCHIHVKPTQMALYLCLMNPIKSGLYSI